MCAKPGRSFLWLKVLAVVAALAAAAFAINSYLRPTAKVETVFSGPAIDAKPGSVEVKEEYSMQMKSAVAGRVISKNYNLETGKRVKEGDILVQLDTADVEIDIDQARNAVENTKQRIAVGPTAQFLLETAKSDFANQERLYKMGQVSESDYQKARRAVETYEKQIATEKVMQQADLDVDETTLRQKERIKEKMTIRSPFEGEMSTIYAHPGDLIDLGSPIVTLITTAREVQAKISEEDFANVRKGQKVTVTFLPYGAWIYHGTVKKILPTADPETRRHLVDLDVTDIDPAKLIPGITGEVSIEVGEHNAKAIIPRRALLNDNVFVVKDGVVELRPVTKGYVWLTGVEITAGLEPGEQVIVDDLDGFREGDKVKVQELPADAIAKKK